MQGWLWSVDNTCTFIIFVAVHPIVEPFNDNTPFCTSFAGFCRSSLTRKFSHAVFIIDRLHHWNSQAPTLSSHNDPGRRNRPDKLNTRTFKWDPKPNLESSPRPFMGRRSSSEMTNWTKFAERLSRCTLNTLVIFVNGPVRTTFAPVWLRRPRPMEILSDSLSKLRENQTTIAEWNVECVYRNAGCFMQFGCRIL